MLVVARSRRTAAGLAPPYLAGRRSTSGIKEQDIGALDVIVVPVPGVAP